MLSSYSSIKNFSSQDECECQFLDRKKIIKLKSTVSQESVYNSNKKREKKISSLKILLEKMCLNLLFK